MNFKRWIKRQFGKVRLKVVMGITKRVTPQLFGMFELIGFNKPHYKWKNNATPRPATLLMRGYFKDKEIVGVEIGVLEGDNSKSLLHELNIKKLFLIDVWELYSGQDTNYEYKGYNMDQCFKKVIRRFKDNEKVVIMKSKSEDAIWNFKDDSLDFVYIDGNHNYKYVYQDLELWTKKIKHQGIIAGHDIFYVKDVYRAVKDWCDDYNQRFFFMQPDFYIILDKEKLK